MSHDTRKLIGTFLFALSLVAMVSLLGLAVRAYAEDSPSAAAYEASDRIKEITPRIWAIDNEIGSLREERASLESEQSGLYDKITEEGWQYDYTTDSFSKGF